MLDQLKQRIKVSLARFAKRKTQQQAEGMAKEAQGIFAHTRDLARSNPRGFAVLVLLGVGFLFLWRGSRQKIDNPS